MKVVSDVSRRLTAYTCKASSAHRIEAGKYDAKRGCMVRVASSTSMALPRRGHMVTGDVEAVVEVWILILRRDIGMEKEGLLALLVSVCF